ncbi:MAG TPA: hypothetical protein VLL25_14440, partial [Acidimicrobiales bacterium]|nr:hypothetical protein [Acidimicrobiales bacterium]
MAFLVLGRRRQLIEVPRPEAHAAAPDEKFDATYQTALSKVLVECGLATEKQISEALERQAESGVRMAALLVESGAVDEHALVKVLAEQFELPIVDLRQVTPEAAALDLLPESTARVRLALPLRINDGQVDIAAAEPSKQLERWLATTTGYRVHLLVAPPGDLRRAI